MAEAPLFLDHVFIICDIGAPEADDLLKHGLTEGSGNVHAGQGTANRRFFFNNFMLELLWVCNPADAASAAVAPTGLWTRWMARAAGASRFGLLFGGVPPPHVATRPYQPAYLPPGRAIEAACDIPLDEPALFFLPWLAGGGRTTEPTAPPAPIREITGVALGTPDPAVLSAPLAAMCACGLLDAFPCSTQLLEIRYRSGSGGLMDCRPRLPLVFRGM